jgi:hypothetical protein
VRPGSGAPATDPGPSKTISPDGRRAGDAIDKEAVVMLWLELVIGQLCAARQRYSSF